MLGPKAIQTLHNKRIFILEDNIHNRVIFTMTLMTCNVQMEFERWGRQTLQKLEFFMPVDLIILDLMLPNGKTGYDTFTEIRSHRAYDHIPIIAVSAAEPATALPKAREMGFAGFISKPIDDELFPQQVAQVIAGQHVWYAGERYQG